MKFKDLDETVRMASERYHFNMKTAKAMGFEMALRALRSKEAREANENAKDIPGPKDWALWLESRVDQILG